MTLKIYANVDISELSWAIPNMFFDFNNQDYKIDVTPQNVIYDINVVAGGTECILSSTDLHKFNNDVKSKIKLWLHIYDDSEDLVSHTVEKLGNLLNDNLYFLAVQENPQLKHKNVLYVDFWFNIIKGYYTHYPFKPDTQRWYYYNDHAYVLPDIPYANSKTRIYVAPNRIGLRNDAKYHERPQTYRKKIVLTLKKYKHLGHIGSVTLNKSWVLWPHGDYPECNDINTLMNINQTRYKGKFDSAVKKKWGYAPIHYEYLRDTFISIYSETIEYGDEYFVSEKTYDPLIRGHFILPYSNAGFVTRLRSLGFKFPDFIDYSYDNIVDNDARYAAYHDEMCRLVNIPLDNWRQYWNDNIDILLYNRRVFFERPYDRIDLLKLIEKNS